MKVTLIHGPAKCGKTRAIVKRFAEESNRNPIIITPSSESIRYIKNFIFSETSLPGFCGQRIITFDHIVNILMERCKELSKINKYFFLRDIVNRMELKYFFPVKGFSGFYEILSRFISELKSGEIMPEMFLKGITKKGAAQKDKEIYAIYSAYQEELHKLNIYDHEGKFWQAQQLIEEVTLGPFSDCRLLIVDGFWNFSPAELKIIQSLGKYVDEIIITQGVQGLTLNNVFKDINEVSMPPVERQPDRIRIISCPGQLREVEEIAREIKRLIIHNARKPTDIAVLFRDLTEYKELIYEVFNRYGIPYYIPEGIPLIKSPVIRNILRTFESLPPRGSFGAEYEKFLDILDSLIILDEKMDSKTYHDMLVIIAENVEQPVETYRGGVVQVLDVHRARGLSFPVVFIGGLIEKGFPKQIPEEPLYGDIERAELRKYGINVEESKEKQKEELSLFYSAVNTAQELLYLTYPATDSQGKEELTSYYVDEIKRLYPDKIDTKKVHLAYLIPEFEDVYTYQDLVTRVMYNYHNNIRNEVTMAFYKDDLLKTAQWDGIITDKKILEKLKSDYGKDYRFSVSQFNEYGTCPFSYFSKRVLGLESIKELEDEILPVDEGILYHAILREYFAEGGDILEIAERHFRLTQDSGVIKTLALWNIKKEEIINNLENIIRYETNELPPLGIKRTPAFFEIPFGMEGKEPLIISGIQIRGKIDRIDLTEYGLFIVIDYKSGGKPISVSEILKGTNLQLPIYVMAAKDVLRIDTDALEAYFFHLKRRKYFHANPLIHYKPTKKGLKPNPRWDECMDATKKYVTIHVEGIRTGKFPTSPGDECPSYCDYKDICRYQ